MLLNLDNCYVVGEDGSVDIEFVTGKLQLEQESGGPSVRVIFVAAHDNKVLVAVPFSSWHRTIASRVLEPGSFKKPVPLEVIACREDSRSKVLDGKMIKIWMGFFTVEYAALVDAFSSVFDSVDHDFSEEDLIPYPEALRDLAAEHFAFFSANEDPPGGQEDAGSAKLGARVSKLEDLLQKMHVDIQKMINPNGPTEQPTMRAPTSKQKPSKPQSTRPPKVQLVEEATAPAHQEFPDLDPTVVAAALQSGIDNRTLIEMQKLVNVNKKGAAALKQVNAAPLADPLSESEEEEEHGGEGSGSQKDVGDPMHKALEKLTKIVSHLAATKNKKGSRLEQALDGVSSSAEPSLSSAGTKRSAAARRALRLALTESPSDIYELVERLMQEDVVSHSLEPGLEGATSFTSRGWVEHRSHIGAYKAVAHCAWGTAGILDSLRGGRVAEARARSALLLLQIDQSCCDKGSWSLSSELSLENPPPLHNLVNHSPPDVVAGELPFSKILDPRWAEVTLAFLRDRDDYIMKRRNLGRPHQQVADGEEEEKEPRRRPRVKAKAKASSEA